MYARILRSIVIVWLMVSPLNAPAADLPPITENTANSNGSPGPIDLLSPIELRPPLRPLAAGEPQTITLELESTTLIANSGATAVITATVYDLTGDLVSDVSLGGFISPAERGTINGLGITSGGIVTGTWTAGTAIGSGTIEIGNGVVSGTAAINLTASTLTTITVAPSSTSVTAGLTTTFTATGSDAFGNEVAITPIWSTDGGSIDANGVFTAQNGVATGRVVTATQDSIAGTAIVNIVAGQLNSITVSPSSANVAAGGTQLFTAAGSDQHGNTVPITPTWTTNGGSINSSSGLFTADTAVAAGRLVTATYASVPGTATVNIVAGQLNSITVSPSSANVAAGGTQLFTAAGSDQHGNTVPITPTWITNGGSINASGLFTADTAVAAGRLVTATYASVPGTAIVNIVAGPLNTVVVSPTSANVAANTTRLFTANGFDQFGNAVPITPTWTTNGGSINPSSGLFTAQITATAGRLVTATHDAVPGTANVNITAGPLNTVVVSPTNANVVASTTRLFTANGFDQFGNAVPITPTWTTNGGSINPSSGLFTAQITVTTGRLVTATHDAVPGTANVNITAAPLNTIVVSPTSANVVANTTRLFTANGFDQFGNAVPITPTWTTNGGSINPSSGLFTAQITATAGRLVTATHDAVPGTANVNILAGPLNQIIVAPSAVTLTVATTRTFSASGFDQYGNAVVITPTWTSNGGTINASGVYTAQTAVATGRRVTATYGITTGFALVNLQPGAPYTLTVQPPTAVISAGQRITYTAIATDTYGNAIGSVTGSTVFSIAPASGGNFAANVVTPTVKNTWVVTGVNGSAVGTAILTVTAATFSRLTIENAPAGSGSAVNAVTMNIYNTLPVYAVAYDVFNNLIGARSSTWSGTGTVSGNLAPTTGISTTFTPVVSGTGTIGATSSTITDTTGTITVQAPVMRISKIDNPDPATPGELIQYTLRYTNTGNAIAQNVVITETYPPSVTIPAIPPPSPPPTTGNNVWSIGNLNPGDSGAIIVYAQVPSQLPVGTVLTNVVRAGASKINTDIFTQTTAVNAQPDVSLNLSDSNDPVRVGEQYVYNLQYQNTGSAPVNSVRITLTIPSSAAYVSASPPPDISQPGYKVWLTNTLPADSVSRLIVVTMRVANPIVDLTTLNTQATIDSNETTPYSTSELTLVYSPKFDLIKTAAPTPPGANELLTYTLSYANSGSTYASSVVVTDRIPISSSFVSCVPLGCSFAGGIVTWNLGQLNPAANGALTTTVRVNNNLVNGTVLTSTAGISTSVENVSATALLTGTVTSAPDVSLSKSDSLTEIAADQIATYVLSYANLGTAPAANVVITDRLPAYMTFVGCSSCVATSGVYSFTLGTVNASASGTVTISARLASTLPAGLRVITNTAAIRTSTAGDGLANNTASDVNNISTHPVLDLRVNYDSGTPYPGKVITYTLRYTNTSAMDTIGVVITTTRPAWLAGPPNGWSGNNGIDLYPIGNLAAGQGGLVTYVITLPLTYTLDMNAFSANFIIQDGGPGGLPIASHTHATLIGVPDLSITQVIVPPAVVPGQKFSATLVIRNNGLGQACNPKAVNCSGFYVDAFINPATPPPSYPFQRYGDPYAGVPPITAGGSVTVVVPNLVVTSTQHSILYFKIDNFDCNPSDHSDPCLPSHSSGGLVPEYDETNNVAGPISPASNKIYLPFVRK